MGVWAAFFQTAAGASATLAGLLVVAISINLARILEYPSLPDRAAAALVPMAGAMVVSMLALVPGQPTRVFGGELLAAGLLIWVLSAIFFGRSHLLTDDRKASRWWTYVAFNVAQGLPMVLAGGLLLLGVAGGLYWAVPGILAALVIGIVNAWVLLIEILR